jgi:hypothetical protein
MIFSNYQNLDVSWYAKAEYKSSQMEEIRLGLVDKINVESYLDPKLNTVEMRKIRLKLTYKRK